MNKPANNDFPIHELLAQRWSPRAFADRPVEHEELRSLFEAARWAASSMNEQPWRFVVASKENHEAFAALASTLMPKNREWAEHAAVLIAVVAAERFRRNDKPNKHAWHDVGQAVASLSVEATARGLVLHQMGGFDGDALRTTLGLPDGYAPVSVIALGHPGEPEQLSEEMAQRETAPRTRLPQEEVVFWGRWAAPAP